MSTSALTAFFERLRQDPELAAGLGREVDTAVAGTIASFGSRSGFAITSVDVEQLLQDPGDELSEEDLELVAGGVQQMLPPTLPLGGLGVVLKPPRKP